MTKGELARAIHGVPGWLTHDEAWALHEAARTHSIRGRAMTVVEIGSWQGRSTIALALGLRERSGGTVFAVDPHRDSALHRSTGVTDTYAAFAANVSAAGLDPYVQALRESSANASSRFGEGSVDLLFVDGSHLYEDVCADIDLWAAGLADGATVAFHDARDEPGVVRAIAERVKTAGSPFSDLHPIENLMLATFRGRARATKGAIG